VEEDIKILEDYIYNKKETMKEQLVIAIENLIKRNKELEEIEIKAKGGEFKVTLEGLLEIEHKIIELKDELDTQKRANDILVAQKIELEKDRDKLKKALGKRITYCNELEKDLFKNCSNYVVPKSVIKEEFQKKRNEIFGCTYVDEEQWQPFDKALNIINDLEKKLLEDK
jgi:hypothetical protein